MSLKLVSVFAVASLALLPGEEPVDLATVHLIRAEAFENSKVMNHLFYLTDVNGPRVTGSPGYRAAGEWVAGRLKEYGLTNVNLEPWGPFGRGWSYSRFSAHLLEPSYQPIIGFPLAWSPGTEGVLIAEPVFAPMRAEADFERYKGKLRGKIVLIDNPRDTPMRTTPLGNRLSDADLSQQFFAPIPELSGSPDQGRFAMGPAGQPRRIGPDAPRRREFDPDSTRRTAGKRNQFLKEEGALAVVSTGYNGDGGTVFASSLGSYNSRYPDPPPAVAIAVEHYNRIVRLLENKIPVKMELEVKTQFHTETEQSFNVVGEIAGGAKKDEVVILGAHLDSWHGATGATDNATGTAAMIEAMRILKALNKPLARTVRIALWGGEEQGLLGSRAYVKQHYADPEVMKPTPEHAKVAAYFNHDNGTGRLRGIYLQGNDMVRPIFEAWLRPFHDLGASTVTIRNTSGTDHLAFDAVGIPGFQFIQDPIEYSSRTHHSNMDTYDRVQEADLKQASAIIASFAYHAATRNEMLPRKPLPKPRPRRDADAAKPQAPSND